jgi:hypothetical protein
MDNCVLSAGKGTWPSLHGKMDKCILSAGKGTCCSVCPDFYFIHILYFTISFLEVKVVVPDYQTQILNPESFEFDPSSLLELAVDRGSNS